MKISYTVSLRCKLNVGRGTYPHRYSLLLLVSNNDDDGDQQQTTEERGENDCIGLHTMNEGE